MQAKEAALLFTEALGALSPQLSENLAEYEDDLQLALQRDASLTHLPHPEPTPPTPPRPPEPTRGAGADDGEQLVEDKVKHFFMHKI